MQRELDVSMEKQSILPIIHPEPFYGNPSDVPDRPVVFAGLEFKVPSSAVGNLPLFTRSRATGGKSRQAAAVAVSKKLLHHCVLHLVFAQKQQRQSTVELCPCHYSTVSACYWPAATVSEHRKYADC